MKINIPISNNFVEDHFSHCAYYSVYEIEDEQNIISKELIRIQERCGCKTNIVAIVKEMGVTFILFKAI